MQIPALVEKIRGNGYRARATQPFVVTVKAATRETALAKLRDKIRARLKVQFVQLYTPLLYHWARKVGLQPQDATDLTQDVFTTLFQRLPDFHYDRARSFRSWLRTIRTSSPSQITRQLEGERRRHLRGRPADVEQPLH